MTGKAKIKWKAGWTAQVEMEIETPLRPGGGEGTKCPLAYKWGEEKELEIKYRGINSCAL